MEWRRSKEKKDEVKKRKKKEKSDGGVVEMRGDRRYNAILVTHKQQNLVRAII